MKGALVLAAWSTLSLTMGGMAASLARIPLVRRSNAGCGTVQDGFFGVSA